MEIEAKFAVPDKATWLKLQTLTQLAGYAISPGETKQVHDTFVDTPDQQILKSRHVCRQREIDGHILMTLKSKQVVVGAVHQREELEVTLEGASPIGQWPPSEIRDRLLGLVGDVALSPLFDQHQTRSVHWVTQGARRVAELSVDWVQLALAGQEQTYYEVEVELKDAGTEDDLARLAACLADEWGLPPEPRSKFSRALALATHQALPGQN